VFLGEYLHSLDDKGRLTIPSKLRNELAAGLVITRNPGGHCLLLMPIREWERIAARASALPLTDPRSALLRRALFSAAEDMVPDRQGRILLSQRLRDFAQIQSQVIVVGMNTYIELWDPTLWETHVLQALQDQAFLDGDLFAALDI
jgi:MraZ protein